MVAHDRQDFIGKATPPIVIGVVGPPLVSRGWIQETLGPSHPAFMALMFVGAVVNFLLIGIVGLPILTFRIRRDRSDCAS